MDTTYTQPSANATTDPCDNLDNTNNQLPHPGPATDSEKLCYDSLSSNSTNIDRSINVNKPDILVKYGMDQFLAVIIHKFALVLSKATL